MVGVLLQENNQRVDVTQYALELIYFPIAVHLEALFLLYHINLAMIYNYGFN